MRKWLVTGLVLLAAAQVGLLLRFGGGDATDRWVTAGDELARVEIRDDRGTVRGLAPGRTTLLMVFHSECGHCERVAPVWRAWLDEHRGSATVVALSKEPVGDAEAYAARHGWAVPVWTTTSERLGDVAHALTGRTPWLFVLTPEGVVVDQGHGDELARLGALAVELAAGGRGAP